MDIPEQANRTTIQEDFEPELEMMATLAQQHRSQGRIILERFMRNKAATVGLIMLIVLVLFCFVGPWVSGHSHPDLLHPTDPDLAPTVQFPLGTDDVGRDQLARAMFGGQISLLVGLGSMLAALLFGVTVGSVAGFYGGVVDNILMRFTDIMLSIPTYLLLFVLSISFIANNPSPPNIILLISIFSWAIAARVVRGEFLSLKEREYVLAARTIGANDFSLMFRHILPNAAGPIIVNATLLIGNNIILESVLSYFGFGLRPPTASWGNLVAYGQGLFDSAPWLVMAPALLIFLTVLSCNLVGDGLRDALDP
ncbi:MAG TPA: ABC transporter permease, partial [Ktedonobacteraceae bacterium]